MMFGFMVAVKQADIFQRGLDNRWKGLRAVQTLEIDKKIEKTRDRPLC